MMTKAHVPRNVPPALAMPVVAAAVMAGLLVASHHTSLPSLSPSASAQDSRAAAHALPCEHGITRRPFTGIAINPGITSHARSFQKVTRTRIQVIEFYNPFTQPFQRWEAAAGDSPRRVAPDPAQPAACLAGTDPSRPVRRRDPPVRRFGQGLRLPGRHLVRPRDERLVVPMGRAMDKAAAFIAAWRHIHDIFVTEGATNVIWSWDPSHQYRYQATMASLWYPGNAYVDWVGIDGYLGPGQTFAQVFATQLSDIRRVTSKPVYLAETGVAGGPDQAWQIAGLFAALKKYHLTGLVWIDLDPATLAPGTSRQPSPPTVRPSPSSGGSRRDRCTSSGLMACSNSGSARSSGCSADASPPRGRVANSKTIFVTTAVAVLRGPDGCHAR